MDMTTLPNVPVPALDSPVMQMQAALLAVPPEQRSEIPVIHEFAKDLYGRAIIIPAGTVLVGKIHKSEHIVIVMGDVDVQDEHGMMTRMQGFRMFTSKPGTKRAIRAHEDTIFITVHATDLKDLAALEAHLIQDEPMLEKTP